MTTIAIHTLFDPVIDAAANAVWDQWSAIGAGTAGSRPLAAVIDPEALLLGSVALSKRDHRFHQVLQDWVIVHARLVSVQRLRNLARDFPTATRDRLAALAQFAMIQGHDPRWRSLQIATVSRRSQGDSRLPQVPPQQFSATAALWFRLRMALGVGIKADALTFLLAHAERASVPEVAQATGYPSLAVRRSLDELVAAGFVASDESAGGAAHKGRQYRADHAAWQHVARLPSAGGMWGYWKDRFAFVAHVTDFLESANGSTRWNATQLGDQAREFMQQHPDALHFPGNSAAENFRGTLEETGAHFASQLERLAKWLKEER